MNPAETQAAFAQAVRLLRAGRPAEALPLLETAVENPNLTYARPSLAYARALLTGTEAVAVTLRERTFRFALVSGNLGLDLHHVDGRFFETDELLGCERLVPRRSVIVDVGANTGNHLVFFAGFLAPRLLIPVEPVPAAVVVLRRNLALNGLSVDERGLGLAVGRAEGRVRLDAGPGADLVVARTAETEAEGEGTARVTRLDDLVPERIDFLKVDVEGFEEAVLAGAERVLSEDKPLLMLEVADAARETLPARVARHGYQPVGAFQGHGYRNVLFRVR